MEPLMDKHPLRTASTGGLDSFNQEYTRSTLNDKLGQMLGGGSQTTSHRIMSVKMDISAPCFIIPQKFTGPGTSMVVLDLGRVTFSNVTDWSTDEVDLGPEPIDLEMGEDDDDEFQTPPSSPGGEEIEETGSEDSKSTPLETASLQGALHSLAALRRLQQPYERYLLHLTDLQISVGQVEESEGHWNPTTMRCQHLMESFTLSMKIQRLLEFSFEAESPTLYLAADLPSLKFHIDEHKINTVVSCLNAVRQSHDDFSLSQTKVPSVSATSSRKPEDFRNQEVLNDATSVGSSMYHSAIGSFLESRDDVSVETTVSKSTIQSFPGHSLRSRRASSARRRHNSSSIHRKLLIAIEKQVHAKLSVNEVLLSLSSKGRVITELNVPEVKLEFLKRPYDITLRLLVQDLFVVDRIQAFGPEYELMVCSSGRALLGPSPVPSRKGTNTPSSDGPSRFGRRNLGVEEATVLELLTGVESQGALLTLGYEMLKPLSPHHPAIMEAEEDRMDEEEGGKQTDECDHPEPVIHRVNIQCTALDAIANQETMTELVSFFQQIWAENQNMSDANGIFPTQSHDGIILPKKKQVPLQTEVKVTFERLGVRMLKTVHSSQFPCTLTPTSPSKEFKASSTSSFFASIMLYGLTVEGKISTDISISGRLEGVHVRDVTAKGQNYPDILVIGTGNEKFDEPGLRTEEKPHHSASLDDLPQFLSFSLDRSPHSNVTGHSLPRHQPDYKSDVHLTVFVPAIHYLHSVNIVYEMELFVIRIVKYFTIMTDSIKDAAVDVAIGLVGEKTKLTKGLSRLHSSFGHAQLPTPEDSSGRGVVDETDAGLLMDLNKSHFFFDVSVQSPIIVLPSSLEGEECLVAHLGEIKARNEYIYSSGHDTLQESNMEESFTLPHSPVERMTFSVSNISLHASQTKESRKALVASEWDRSLPENCCKVLKEASLSLQIEKHLKEDTIMGGDENTRRMLDETNADLVITGTVCDPLLVQLPKAVFEQIRTTVKHGIRKKPRRRRKTTDSNVLVEASKDVLTDNNKSQGIKPGKAVHFHPDVQEMPEQTKFPKICASFTVPRLSLELKHLIDSKDRDLVCVSLDDLSAKYQQDELNYFSTDVSLKSILVQDLLQPKDSEYRNILSSSTKPCSFSPSPSTHGARYRTSSSLTPSVSRHFLCNPLLMSTPILHSPFNSYSPLRSFSPYDSKSVSDNEATLKATSSSLSDLQSDLLTVQAFFVGNKHPLYKEKFKSTSIHVDVDFSSVFVIINLQTWVLLLDFVGIGVPTPPPSRSTSPIAIEVHKEPSTEKAAAPANKARSLSQTGMNLLESSFLGDSKDSQSINASLVGERRKTSRSDVSRRSRVPDSVEDGQQVKVPPQLEKVSVWGVEGKLSLKCRLNVKSLTVTFNKPEHPLAKGSVSGVSAEVNLSQGNMNISGALGKGSVIDMTETGAYYRERFVTTGEKALTFEIFKYGRPDPLMERPFDVQAKVRMASVRYLHTMRFLKEILAFISHFPQLIDAFQRMKANAEGKLDYAPGRKARISLDVTIDGPILLIPKHAFSPDLMVGDIGHLTLSNSFCYDSEEGTITHMREKRRLERLELRDKERISESSFVTAPREKGMHMLSPLDTRLSVDLSRDRFSSLGSDTMLSCSSGPFDLHLNQGHTSHQNWSATSSIYSTVGSSLDAIETDRRRVEGLLETFKGPCLLDCIDLSLEEVDVFSAKRVMESGNKFRITRQKGIVLKEKGAAKLFIERNLYEDFCRNVPDFHIEGTLQAIHVMLDKSQLELIKGLVEMNLGETIEEFEKPSSVIRDPVAQPISAEVWTGFLFRMQFVEVQLEFLSARKTEVLGSQDHSLARFDIQESEFTFESRSNQHKTVDLTSNAVIGYDTRYEGYDEQDKPSIFEEVLRPTFAYDKDSPKNILQVEIHVAIDPKEIKASILLNKLRLVAIFDVILELKNFIFDKLEETPEEDIDDIDSPSPFSIRPAGASLRQKLMSTLQTSKPEKNTPRHVRVKLSITETDFVVLEDTTSLDSNAVVLKCTLILNFHSIPDKEKLLDCSIDGLELFSCNLSNEDETALSILDPVTISLEIRPPELSMAPKSKKNGGLKPVEGWQVFGIDIQQLHFRLSYNDIKLFLAIAQSLPTLNQKMEKQVASRHERLKEVDGDLLKQLLPLGFTEEDILKALNSKEGSSELAEFLKMKKDFKKREKESSLSSPAEGESEEEEKKAFSIQYIQVHIGSLSVCLIDDCVDHDVPLLDFFLADLQAEHNLAEDSRQGRARAHFAGDYYNRHISAWEPVLESWMCELNWKMMKLCSDVDTSSTVERLQLTLTSKNQLNINVTSSLIHILRITQASWTKDLSIATSSASAQTDFVRSHRRTASGKMPEEEWEQGQRRVSTMEKGLALLHSVRFVSTTRQRSKFVPFLLRNNTGLPLKFATLTSVPSKVYVSHSALFRKSRAVYGEGIAQGRTSEWSDVMPGGERPFDFTTTKKNRHRDTRELVVHQLLVRVAGWQCIDTPVSVDKIGVFFREVQPSDDTDIDLFSQFPTRRERVRLVFAISLNEVQKVVNVRSALVLRNTMEIPLEIKLEPILDHNGSPASVRHFSSESRFISSYVSLPVLAPKDHLSVPLHMMSWDIYLRPQHWGVQYCSKHLAWKHVVKDSAPTSHMRSCDAIGGDDLESAEAAPPPFQFCVMVQRENYPADNPSSSPSSSPSSANQPRPAHTLTVFPPLTITNLLPCDIQFSLWSSTIRRKDFRQQRRLVSPGQDVAIYSVSLESPVEFDIAMEGFERCQGCLISADKVGVLSLILEDYQGRPLRLIITTVMIGGGAIKVSISCPYWLINRTGLPLVVKQEGMSTEAAGQLSENEGASTTTPFLFSFSEGEFVEKCSMRLGRDFQGSAGKPKWCAPFGMVSDSSVCRVFVRSTDNRPDQEFQIGMDIRRGRGRYRQTKVVTFVAHYQLENRTQYRLAYLQRHQLKEEEKLQVQKRIPSILPGAILPFHWQRTDLDQLLCLKVLDIQDSLWSGGFVLDKDSSFHLNIRSTYSYSAFIRCQITLRGATFHVVFSDAAKYPPPFRLENLSQTPITCYQEGTKSSLAMSLNPGQSVPYAWDEQTLPESMCVEVKGGANLKVKLEQFGAKGKVIYESYFYIGAYATFLSPEKIKSASSKSAHLRRTASSELVLDVPQGTAVIFQRKDPERRTQLWRMSASGKLVHIVSSDEDMYVLDIAGGRLPGPGQYEPLVLRKASTLRAHSQTWNFLTGETLVMEKSPSLCVQSRSGYEALREGADAVLGVASQRPAPIPRQQQIRRMKHSPGSGVLSVSVVPEGPTRILRVVDQNTKYWHTLPHDNWIVVENGQVAPSSASDVDLRRLDDREEDKDKTAVEIEVSLVLEEGIGVSLINSVPEELIYAVLRGLKVEFISSREVQKLSLNVQYIQVDNKLSSCFTPVMAYPTPAPSGEPTPSYPVLKLNVERVLYRSPYGLVFKMADFRMHDMTVIVEERLLFKILQWAGVGQTLQSVNQSVSHEVSDLISYRVVMPATTLEDSMQLYFKQFSIASTELRVSVFTTSQLPEDLKAIKYQLGFPLVKFESPVKLRGFYQSHMIGDIGVYADSLMKHYKKVIKAQAINILGSVDFLGNPMGLVSDVASGVSGMMSAQPDVVGLVRDVTHGMSDTTSKLTGTLSHVLGKATFDTSYQEEREQILESCQTSGDHLKAGLMGLSSGVFGGMMSMVTQPYKDTRSYGLTGLFTGLAKGVVGTVAKPMAGLFDLASETSAALRESTSRVSRQQPNPVRHTRCCLGANGALTSFSTQQAKGQEYLLRITDGKLSEKLISYEKLYEAPGSKVQMRVIISSQFLYFFQGSPPDPSSLHSQISLDEMHECKSSIAKTSIPTVYIVLNVFDKHASYNAPKYRCSDEKVATKVAQLINYAKNLYEEEKHVVRTFRLQQGTVLW